MEAVLLCFKDLCNSVQECEKRDTSSFENNSNNLLPSVIWFSGSLIILR